MSTKISITAEPLVDPRGLFIGTASSLAPRPSFLKGRTILLLDNRRLAFERAIYGPLFHWLARHLQTDQGAQCVQDACNILSDGREEIGALADKLAGRHFDGVVIGLGHAGITQPSTLLAAELERRGVPCVLLCSAWGFSLATATASNHIPGLPLVLCKPATGCRETFGEQEAGEIAPAVVGGLTRTPAELGEDFRKGLPGTRSRSDNRPGEILLESSIALHTTRRDDELSAQIDAGCFASEFYERLCAEDMCDGLPVIPPTTARVNAMLRFTDLDPRHSLIDELPPSGAAVTVQTLAANAVMAGCKPEYLPILIAVFQAMADPAYRLFLATITTHPGGNAVIVSGPLAKALGIHSGAGCLGPGFRANATIGRAITLTILNVARAIPGKSDLSVFGSAAEFTYCVAESDTANPWSTLNSDLYDPGTTSVTVHKCEGPHNILGPHEPGPEPLLGAIASTAATKGGNNRVHLGQLLVFLNPDHAKSIADAGWSKQNVKEYLFEKARHPIADIRPELARANFPPQFLALSEVPVMRSPEDVIVVVCGGRGPHSMVAVPWGMGSAVSRPVTRKDGTPLRSVRI